MTPFTRLCRGGLTGDKELSPPLPASGCLLSTEGQVPGWTLGEPHTPQASPASAAAVCDGLGSWSTNQKYCQEPAELVVRYLARGQGRGRTRFEVGIVS